MQLSSLLRSIARGSAKLAHCAQFARIILVATMLCGPFTVGHEAKARPEQDIFQGAKLIIVDFIVNFHLPKPDLEYDDLRDFPPILVEELREEMRNHDIEVWTGLEFLTEQAAIRRSESRRERLRSVLRLRVHVALCCQSENGEISGAFQIYYLRRVIRDGHVERIEDASGAYPFRISGKAQLTEEIVTTLVNYLENDLYYWIEKYAAE